MKKKIIAAFLTAAMTIGSLSGVTVFAADAGTDEKVEMADASDVDGTTITFRRYHIETPQENDS